MLCLVAIGGVLTRPFKVPEWVWAIGGAAVVVLARLLSPEAAAKAVAAGTDVYLFLAGMMLLAELARVQGVFDWVAGHAVRACGGSRRTLFFLIYGVGIVVTTVLSNDATAVVLTPAVAAAVKTARVEPRPYLFACALIANAASFVLPISNPANLVVFANAMPALPLWLGTFTLPSLAAIVLTCLVLLAIFRSDLAGAVAPAPDTARLSVSGTVTLCGIAFTSLALLAASLVRLDLGAVTLACGAVVFATVALLDRRSAPAILRGISWSVLILVAGLFVLVAAAETTGLLELTRRIVAQSAAWPPPLALASASFATALGSNLINNLPAGLIAGTAVAAAHASGAYRGAVAIGIDLGPNLSVTGSLATILWLTALRREGIDADARAFLRVGAVAMPAALIAAVASLLLVSR